MLLKQGQTSAVLIDFENVKDNSIDVTATATQGGILGTRVYMAPELNLPGAGVLPSSNTDMFSIGVLLLLGFCPESIEDVEAGQISPVELLTQVTTKAGMLDGGQEVSTTRMGMPDGGRLLSTVAGQSQLGDWLANLIQKLLADPIPTVDGGLRTTTTGSVQHSRPTAREILDGQGGSDLFSAAPILTGLSAASVLPFHWQHKQRVDVGGGSPVSRSRLVALSKSDPAVAVLRGMIAETRPQELGIGRDASRNPGWTHLGVGNRHIEFSRAWRLEHSTLWTTYQARLKRVSEDLSRGPPLDALPAMKARKQSEGIRRGLQEGGKQLPGGLREECAEQFLMTGVPLKSVASVLENGLNDRFAGGNAGALFGAGLYFAEDIEKCDQYTGAPAAKMSASGKKSLQPLHEQLYGTEDIEDDVVYVLVCRVIMGYPIRTKGRDFAGNVVPMDRGASQDKSVFFDAKTGRVLTGVIDPETGKAFNPLLHHHSLIAELGGDIDRFREFVVFDGMQVYPEYVVSYRRAAMPDRQPEPEPEPEAEALSDTSDDD